MADLLVVIRTGTTDYDLQGRIRGNLGIPLSAAGRLAAETSASELAAAPPDVLYTSASRAAADTAALVGARLGLPPRRQAGLDDLDLGLWQGMLVADLRRRQPRLVRHWEEDPWSVVPPGGEPLSRARERVATAIRTILDRHPGRRVAVVVPQPIDRMVCALFAGAAPGNLWDVADGGTAVTRLAIRRPIPAEGSARRAWTTLFAAATSRGGYRIAQG